MFQPGDLVKDTQGAFGYVRRVKVGDFSTEVDVYYFGGPHQTRMFDDSWGRYSSSELILVSRGVKK